MGKQTGIAWTDHTFNPWWGCLKVSPGCAHCYAETLDKRWDGKHWGFTPEGIRAPLKTFSDAHWKEPLKWQREAVAAGTRRRVFCASMADVFDEHASPTLRARLWQLIRDTPNLDWQLLTKRPQNIPAMLPEDWNTGYPNVWLGTSVESQQYALERIPLLLDIPAVVRFLSCEPLLQEVKLPDTSGDLHWVIIGGESGPKAREMQSQWVSRLMLDCESQGIPVFFKQTGNVIARSQSLKHPKGEDPTEWPEWLQIQQFPTSARKEIAHV